MILKKIYFSTILDLHDSYDADPCKETCVGG